MAIAYEQSTSVDSGSISSANLAFTNTVKVNSLLIIAVRIGSSSATITVNDNVNAGNYTLARSQVQTTDGHKAWVYYFPGAAAGATTVTVTLTGGPATTRWAIHEYSGLATTSPLDQVNSGQTDATNAVTSGDVTTLVNDELLFACATASNHNIGVYTAGANYTLREHLDGAGGNRLATEDRIVAVTGTYSDTFTFTSTTEEVTGSITTFKIAVGAAASGGGVFDDRFRFRPSAYVSGTSTRLHLRSEWPDDARDFGQRDAGADSRARMK